MSEIFRKEGINENDAFKNTEVSSKRIDKRPEFKDFGKKEAAEVRKGIPEFDMLRKLILNELKNKRPIEKVILSKYKYDRIENWLEKVGIINEDTHLAPLSLYGINIERAESSTIYDMLPVYKTLHAKQAEKMMNWELNKDMFGISNPNMKDKIIKGLK